MSLGETTVYSLHLNHTYAVYFCVQREWIILRMMNTLLECLTWLSVVSVV